jgi:hypothetical protein
MHIHKQELKIKVMMKKPRLLKDSRSKNTADMKKRELRRGILLALEKV